VAAQVDIEYSSGRKERIITDETWKATSGEILRNDIYMGEYIDHRLSLGDFSAYDYDDGSWQAPTLVTPRTYFRMLDIEREPEITVKHILAGEFLHYDGNGRAIYDFKQNAAGVISCLIKGERGAKITFRHGEMLCADGSLYTRNLRRAEATDVYICSGEGEEVFRPLFTYHGCRYAEITVEGNAEVYDLKNEVMYTDLKKTGEFSCSDELINKLYSNIVWGQRSNFLSIPTDCPQRDERAGWTGDAQIFCGSAMFNMDCKRFYEKYVRDILDAQYGSGAVGGIAPTVPHYDYDNEEFNCIAAGWRDAIAVIPYTHYLFYGDKSILYDSVGGIKRLVDFLYLQSDDCIMEGGDGYGDWLTVIANGVDAWTDKSILSTLYFAYSTKICAEICSVLGYGESEYYFGLYEKIKSAFRKRLLDANGEMISPDNKSKDAQTPYLLAYSFGIMTKEEVKDKLVRNVHIASDHLTTGFLGVKFLLPVLCDLGESELAYKILTNKTYPSWLYSVVNGASTVWERWDSYTKDKGFGDEAMNSFNHYSLGSCSEWFFRCCLGINPTIDGAGFKKVVIRPFVDFSGRITSVKG
ncbi:MAG: family 78 glycoside hydrolase catalytic domain, partial [Clostridia bacterium]|nr:family 78 glycoside hydrolase catalytic domain [Clostridia bacterium]